MFSKIIGDNNISRTASVWLTGSAVIGGIFGMGFVPEAKQKIPSAVFKHAIKGAAVGNAFLVVPAGLFVGYSGLQYGFYKIFNRKGY